MRSDAMSIIGLAFQRAKVVKRNKTAVLTYFAHIFQSASYILIYNLAYKSRCNNFTALKL